MIIKKWVRIETQTKDLWHIKSSEISRWMERSKLWSFLNTVEIQKIAKKVKETPLLEKVRILTHLFPLQRNDTSFRASCSGSAQTKRHEPFRLARRINWYLILHYIDWFRQSVSDRHLRSSCLMALGSRLVLFELARLASTENRLIDSGERARGVLIWMHDQFGSVRHLKSFPRVFSQGKREVDRAI